MIESKTREIDGHQYQVTQFAAMTGLRYAVRLVKIIGPGLGKALGGVDSLAGLMEADLSDAGIGGMVQALTDNLDADGTPRLILDLLSATHRDNKEMTETVFNTVYAGNYGELVKALKFVLEVNYGGFFGALAHGDTGSQ